MRREATSPTPMHRHGGRDLSHRQAYGVPPSARLYASMPLERAASAEKHTFNILKGRKWHRARAFAYQYELRGPHPPLSPPSRRRTTRVSC